MPSSIREIAIQTGYSTATVSMALSGSGRMSAETRSKIQHAANALGYQPLPLLSRAFSVVRKPKNSWYRETLGYITEFAMTPAAPDYQLLLHEAARNRAKERGYQVEAFHLTGKQSDHKRLSRILYNRGIRGLIVLPRVQFALPRLYLDWSKFAAVEIGRTLRSPRSLHRIERPIYYELIEAMHALKKAGYRRIGMAVEPAEDKNRLGIYSSVYLLSQERIPARQRIPTLASFGPWNKKTLRVWMEKYKPDVLITHTTITIEWLRELKYRIPEDISVFCSNVGTTSLSGLRSNRTKLGESAVEMLSLLLERDELGISNEPRCWLVPDEWQPGSSLLRPIDGLFRVPER